MIVFIAAFIPASAVIGQSALAIESVDAPDALELGPNVAHRNPTQFISYFHDSTRTLTVGQIENASAQFQPLKQNEIEFGYIDDAVWLQLPVTNGTQQSITRYLLLETNWMQSMQVWLSFDQSRSLILDQDQGMPFNTREIPHQNLVARFELPPGQSAVLWVRYTSQGSTALPINVETELSFIQRSQFRSSKSVIFYALMGLFITVAAISYLHFRHAIFPVYVCYASIVLLYVMHRDGFAFRYLWPGFPNFNAVASLLIGTSLGFFAVLFSRQYLTTAIEYPRTDRILIFSMAGLALLIPYGLFVDEQAAKQAATVAVFLIAVVLLGLGIRSWMDRGRRMIFFVAGWLGVVSASLVTVLGGLVGVEISREITLDGIRLAMVFDALMMGFAMAEKVLQMRRQRDRALTQQVNALQSNLDLHKRLNTLENKYSGAIDSAQRSGKVLADATHDIRQPLFALRASLRSIDSRSDASAIASAGRNLVYLEQLVEEYLEKATSESDHAQNPENITVSSPANLVLAAVTDMFKNDAMARGLALRVRPSKLLMTANPMAVIRIVSNFVSNALRYTEQGGVIVGVRNRHGRNFIAVYDTGPGIDDATLKRVLQRAERGEPDDQRGGKGIGLDIALTLARQHGLATFVNTRPGRGTVFGVALEQQKT